MAATVTIRAATSADCERAMAIAGAGMREFGIEPEFDGLDSDLRLLGVNPNALAEFVALADNRVIGVIILACSTSGFGKVTGFYVDPQFRGYGIGRELLLRVTDAARRAHLAQLRLETWHFMTAAIRLYERSGWVRCADPPPESGADRAYSLTLR